MADKTSAIQMTTGSPIRVSMGLDELREKLNRVASAQEAPFIKLEDAEGRFHLINVAQIVAINGPQ